MSSITFESNEEILGIVVNKPDDSVKTDVNIVNSEINTFIGYIKAMEEGTEILDKALDDHHSIITFIDMLEQQQYINKVTINNINTVFPDLLATAVNINDFTDQLTKTGIDTLRRFLDNKLNQIKDSIVVIYTDSIYKYIAPVLERFNTCTLDEIHCALIGIKNALMVERALLIKNNKLQIFKDGVLYKAVDNLLNDKFIAMLNVAPIEGINELELKVAVDNIKGLLDSADSLTNSPKEDQYPLYSEVIFKLVSIEVEQSIEIAKGSLAKLVEMSNAKKLMTANTNTRDEVINSLAMNNSYKEASKHVKNIVLCLLYKELCFAIHCTNIDQLKVDKQ